MLCITMRQGDDTLVKVRGATVRLQLKSVTWDGKARLAFDLPDDAALSRRKMGYWQCRHCKARHDLKLDRCGCDGERAMLKALA